MNGVLRRAALVSSSVLVLAGCGGGAAPLAATAPARSAALTAPPDRAPSTPTAAQTPAPPTGLIAFVVEYGMDGVDGKTLWTVHADGQDAREIARVEHETFGYPVFAPDGQRILVDHCVADAPCVVASVDLAGGDLRVVADPVSSANEPAISPDGRWIAWSETDGGRAAIWVAHPDGTDRHQVVDPGANPDYPDVGARFPAFSPDARSLVVTIDEVVHVVGVDGSGDRAISPAGRPCEQGRWSPDGAHVITSCDGRLLLLSLDGSAPLDLGAGSEPAFAPDGRWIVYHRYLPGTAHIGLIVAKADGSDPVEIWRTPEHQDVFLVELAWGP